MSKEKLSLAWRGWDSIHPNIVTKFSATLRELDLSNNRLADVMELRAFTRLETLILDCNSLSSHTKFPPMPSLRILWVNKNKIDNLAVFIDKLVEATPNLTYLSMLHNDACPNFFNGGTLAQYSDYRRYVISRLRSLSQLDSQPVSEQERRDSLRVYGDLAASVAYEEEERRREEELRRQRDEERRQAEKAEAKRLREERIAKREARKERAKKKREQERQRALAAQQAEEEEKKAKRRAARKAAAGGGGNGVGLDVPDILPDVANLELASAPPLPDVGEIEQKQQQQKLQSASNTPNTSKRKKSNSILLVDDKGDNKNKDDDEDDDFSDSDDWSDDDDDDIDDGDLDDWDE